MKTIQAYFKTQSNAALCAVRLGLPDAEPEMVEPYESRCWMITIPVPEEAHSFSEEDAERLSVVNHFGGVMRTFTPTNARFVNDLPQSVVDRFEGNSN